MARLMRTTIEAMDLPLEVVLFLRPNLDHWVQFKCGLFAPVYHRGQLARLEKGILAAREEMAADEHRATDRLQMHAIKLGEF